MLASSLRGLRPSAPALFMALMMVSCASSTRTADDPDLPVATTDEDEAKLPENRVTRTASEADDLSTLSNEDLEVLSEADDLEGDSDSGSSIRALTVKKRETGRRDIKTPLPPQEKKRKLTPEEYLSGSHCVLLEDHTKMRAMLAAKVTSPEEEDHLEEVSRRTFVLLEDIRAARTQRGLAVTSTPYCGGETTPVVEQIRQCMGASLDSESDLAAYDRGLTQLRKELERRADLPKRQ